MTGGVKGKEKKIKLLEHFSSISRKWEREFLYMVRKGKGENQAIGVALIAMM